MMTIQLIQALNSHTGPEMVHVTTLQCCNIEEALWRVIEKVASDHNLGACESPTSLSLIGFRI